MRVLEIPRLQTLIVVRIVLSLVAVTVLLILQSYAMTATVSVVMDAIVSAVLKESHRHSLLLMFSRSLLLVKNNV